MVTNPVVKRMSKKRKKFKRSSRFKRIKFKHNSLDRLNLVQLDDCVALALAILLDEDYDEIAKKISVMNKLGTGIYTPESLTNSGIDFLLSYEGYSRYAMRSVVTEEYVYNEFGDCAVSITNIIDIKSGEEFGSDHLFVIKDGKIQGDYDPRDHYASYRIDYVWSLKEPKKKGED